MIEKGKQLFFRYKEIIMYLISGVAVTGFNWILYMVLMNAVGLEQVKNGVYIGNAIAWVLSVALAYVLNKWFVFEKTAKDKKTVGQEILAFYGARAVTGIIEIFGPGLLMRIGLDQTLFGTEGMVAKVAISVLVIVLNYVFSKLFVFRKKITETKGNGE